MRTIRDRAEPKAHGWLVVVLIAATLGPACHHQPPAADDPISLGRRYVSDAAFRREVLVRSLVNPTNTYSRTRLDRYREDVWGRLPEWNPPVAPVTADPSGNADLSPPPSRYRRLEIESVPWTRDALIALGREAFFRYPVQMQPALRTGLAHPAQFGLWRSSDDIGGAVLEQVAVGPPRLAVTCATCHAMPGPDGAIVAGKPNARLDLGAMLADTYPSTAARPVWGKARVDLVDDGINNPTAIADLRAVRSERYLHHDATVRNGLIELAIRIETLIITSNRWALRPPRKLAFAIALYLWSLDPEPVAQPSDASRRGEKIFARTCAGCHAPPDYSGGRVSLAKVGTDTAVGLAMDRQTGTYRIPTLRGVGDRTPLLASGDVATLEELLDPARKTPGHRYGTKLPPDARSDLVAFLRTLH